MTTDNQVSTQTQAAEPSPSQPANNFTVPDTYKDRGWVEKIKSPDDLWKTLDNAQSLLGKRPAGIPAADAAPEEWDKFYEAAGRPASADKYTLPDIEGIPDGVDISGTKNDFMQIMHKSGVTQKQAENIWKEYIGLELGAYAKDGETKAEQKKALDAEFDKITQEHLGGDFESASKLTIEMAGKFVPEALRGSFADLDPKPLAGIALLVKGMNSEIERIKKEYGVEGKITSGDQAAGVDIMTSRQELARLRTSQEARDFLNPKHKETMARIEELSGVVSRHYNK